MMAFIDDHRAEYGVEPICKVLPIAPSTYYAHAGKRADPGSVGAREARRWRCSPEIQRVFAENFEVYGVGRSGGRWCANASTWRAAPSRLMRGWACAGVIRGKPVRTTVSDKAAPCPLDQVNRQFTRRRAERAVGLRLHLRRDLAGFVYVAFVIDALPAASSAGACRRSAHASFVLDALEQALHERRPVRRGGLVHHSDRGSQYVSIRYTERLAEAGIEPSVGSVGDSYDNALAETINGLYKAEVIHRRGPWRSFEAVEFATLEWVDWFNNRRLLEPIGNIPPAEAERRGLHTNRVQPEPPPWALPMAVNWARQASMEPKSRSMAAFSVPPGSPPAPPRESKYTSCRIMEPLAIISSRLRPLISNTGAAPQFNCASFCSMALRRLTAPP
jgi:putative transposase